jgi:protein phosphatase
MRLEISGRAIVGSKEPQQDSWRVFSARGENLSEKARTGSVATGDGTLVVVADGIGGYAGGEIASRVGCDAFARAFFSREGPVADRLSQALEAANAAIAEEKRHNPDLQEMGCTLIGVHFEQDRMAFVSVGDSLLLRSRDDEMHRVNVDHSYFDYLDRQVLGSGDSNRWSIAIGDARRRASLTLAVTGGDLNAGEYGHRPQIAMRPLLADDILIIASDGIETLDLVQLQNFLKHLRPSGIIGIADGLIAAVDGIGKTRSYQDNTTIVVVGASSGVGLTRVAMPSRAAEAAPAGSPEHALRFSWLRLVSNTQLLFGAIIVGVALLVALLLWPRGSEGDGTRTQNPAPAASDKPQTPRRLNSSETAPERVDPNQGVAQQQAAAQQQAVAPPHADTPSAAPNQMPGNSSEAAKSPPVEPVPPPLATPRPATVERDTQDPNAPRIEVRPRADWANFKWAGVKFPVPAADDGQCRKLCNDMPACVAYTWRGENPPRGEYRCEHFSMIYQLQASPKSQSGAREWDNYAWKGDALPPPSPMPNSKPGCFNACLELDACGGYTWSTAAPPCNLYPRTIGEPAQQTGAFSGKLRLPNGRRSPGD